MYAKIFQSIYDGTLVEDWRALITFEQLLILSDADGIVDMTPHAIARRTGIPIEHIEAGVSILLGTDQHSLRIASGAESLHVSTRGGSVRMQATFAKELRLPSHEWAPLRSSVFTRDDFTCVYCGQRGGYLECDHVIPISRGGSNDISNLVTACFTCNRSKRNKTPEEWLQ